MSPLSPSNNNWEDCPAGTLNALAKRSRHRRTLKRASWAIPLTLVTLLSLAWGWLPSQFNLHSATLACDQVVKLLPAYASKSLSTTQHALVEKHLKKCPLCAEKLRTIQAAQSHVSATISNRLATSQRAPKENWMRNSRFSRYGDSLLVMHYDPPILPVATCCSKLPFVAVH